MATSTLDRHSLRSNTLLLSLLVHVLVMVSKEFWVIISYFGPPPSSPTGRTLAYMGYLMLIAGILAPVCFVAFTQGTARLLTSYILNSEHSESCAHRRYPGTRMLRRLYAR
jgi:hypothetical protein